MQECVVENDNGGVKPPPSTEGVNWDAVRRYIAETPPLPAEFEPDEWDEVSPDPDRLQKKALAEASQLRELELLVGSETTQALRANRERAARVAHVWFRLSFLRERKRQKLERLLEDVKDSTWPAWRQQRIEDVRFIVDEITNIDADIADAFENNPRGSEILSKYEFGGVGMERPAQWKGFARKRLSRRIIAAYDATLPIVKIVFGEEKARMLRDVHITDLEVASELKRRLGGARFGENTLELCALAIESARNHVDPQGPRNDANALAQRLLKLLRDATFIDQWLKPRTGDDGRGSGESAACIALLANALGSSRKPTPPRKRPRPQDEDDRAPAPEAFSFIRNIVHEETRTRRPPATKTRSLKKKSRRHKPAE